MHALGRELTIVLDPQSKALLSGAPMEPLRLHLRRSWTPWRTVGGVPQLTSEPAYRARRQLAFPTRKVLGLAAAVLIAACSSTTTTSPGPSTPIHTSQPQPPATEQPTTQLATIPEPGTTPEPGTSSGQNDRIRHRRLNPGNIRPVAGGRTGGVS